MGSRKRTIALVTDGSSVLGNACATYLAKKGLGVYALMADPAGFERRADEFFEVLPAGSQDQESLDAAAATVLDSAKALDVLVSCHSLDMVGAFEDTTESDIARTMEAGFNRHLRAIRAVLPHMRAGGRGRIICVVGQEHRLGTPFMGPSCASQAALIAFVLSLRLEAARFGIGACIVEKPLIWPDSSSRRLQASLWNESSPWRGGAQSFLKKRETEERSGREAMETARTVWEASRRRLPPAIIRSGGFLGRLKAFVLAASPRAIVEYRMKRTYVLKGRET